MLFLVAILVRGLRVTNATETTINITWDETNDAIAYDVLVQDDDGQDISLGKERQGYS